MFVQFRGNADHACNRGSIVDSEEKTFRENEIPLHFANNFRLEQSLKSCCKHIHLGQEPSGMGSPRKLHSGPQPLDARQFGRKGTPCTLTYSTSLSFISKTVCRMVAPICSTNLFGRVDQEAISWNCSLHLDLKTFLPKQIEQLRVQPQPPSH